MESTETTRGASQRETGQSSRPSQNSSNASQRRPGGPALQGNSPTRRHFWLQWLIYIVIINLLFYIPLIFSLLSGQQPAISLSYTSFLQRVELHNVKDVTLTGNAVSRDFKSPLRQPQIGSGNTTVAYSQFTSFVPETGDPNLLPLLEKYSVQVTAQPVQTPWWQTALTILLNALPILLLLYFGYMALRLDAEVERLMTQAHQQAQSVLSERRAALDRLAQALLQEEVLEREQVLAIANGAQNIPSGIR